MERMRIGLPPRNKKVSNLSSGGTNVALSRERWKNEQDCSVCESHCVLGTPKYALSRKGRAKETDEKK